MQVDNEYGPASWDEVSNLPLPPTITLEQALERAKRPEFIPNVLNAVKAGNRAKISYWLRRAMGVSGI